MIVFTEVLQSNESGFMMQDETVYAYASPFSNAVVLKEVQNGIERYPSLRCSFVRGSRHNPTLCLTRGTQIWCLCKACAAAQQIFLESPRGYDREDPAFSVSRKLGLVWHVAGTTGGWPCVANGMTIAGTTITTTAPTIHQGLMWWCEQGGSANIDPTEVALAASVNSEGVAGDGWSGG